MVAGVCERCGVEFRNLRAHQPHCRAPERPTPAPAKAPADPAPKVPVAPPAPILPQAPAAPAAVPAAPAAAPAAPPAPKIPAAPVAAVCVPVPGERLVAVSAEVVAGARVTDAIRDLVGTAEAPAIHPKLVAALSGSALMASPTISRAVLGATTAWTAAQRDAVRQVCGGQLVGLPAALVYPQLLDVAVAFVVAEAAELGQHVNGAILRQVGEDPARFARTREAAAATRALRVGSGGVAGSPAPPAPQGGPRGKHRRDSFFNGTCDACGRYGHKKRDCRDKGRKEARREEPKEPKPKKP